MDIAERPPLSLGVLVVALVLLAHGAIHALGFVKGFELAAVPALERPISRSVATLWGAATLVLALAALLLLSARSSWWLVASLGVVLSQIAIFTSFSEARFGTLVNLLLAVPITVAVLTSLPSSLNSRFRADSARALASAAPTAPPVTEADLNVLPEPIRRYLRFVGAVGAPRVRSFRATFRGSIRSKPDGAWMPFEARQISVVTPGTRLFLLNSSLFGLPFTAYHRYERAQATMEVKAVQLFSVIDARGPEMNQSETVTLLNDLCVLAPATLIDQDIDWQVLSPTRVRAVFSLGNQRVSAELEFDARGALINFHSDDRYLSTDGKKFALYRWSTPLRDYRRFANQQVAARGDATWTLPDGELVYGKFELTHIEYNVSLP